MQSAGTDDSGICACCARSNVFVESVSKLKGRSINVSGNSFIVSTKTNSPAVTNALRNSGILILVNDCIAVTPSDLDALLICSQWRSIPESIGCQATAKNLTIYAKTSIERDPVIIQPVAWLTCFAKSKIPIAITAPGTA